METLEEHIVKYVIERLIDLKYHRVDTAESLGICYRTLTKYIHNYEKNTGIRLIRSLGKQFDDYKDFSMFATNEERLKHANLEWEGGRYV